MRELPVEASLVASVDFVEAAPACWDDSRMECLIPSPLPERIAELLTTTPDKQDLNSPASWTKA